MKTYADKRRKEEIYNELSLPLSITLPIEDHSQPSKLEAITTLLWDLPGAEEDRIRGLLIGYAFHLTNLSHFSCFLP